MKVPFARTNLGVRLALVSSLLVIALIVGLERYTVSVISHNAYLAYARHLELVTRFVEDHCAGTSRETPVLTQCAREISALTDARITLIDTTGIVLADSDVPTDQVAGLENHRFRPEVDAALRTGAGRAVRLSRSLHRPLFYYARRVVIPGLGPVVVRAAVPTTQIARAIREQRAGVGTAGLIALLAAVGASFLIAFLITRRLRRVAHGAARLAAGELDYRLTVRGQDEIARLAAAFNTLAERLARDFRSLGEEREQLAAILGGMDEGVILIGPRREILYANPSAQRAFGIEPGRLYTQLLESIRSHELAGLVQTAQETGQPVEREIETHYPDPRAFHCRVLPLAGQGRQLVVMTDITRLRRLEQLRREMVANVAHELRSPLTVIKGYLELLRARRLAERERRTTLATMLRTVGRLARLDQDLLDLATLETPDYQLTLGPCSLGPVIDRVRARFQPALTRKSIRLALALPGRLPRLKADCRRLEEVFANLLDNAVRHTPARGRIEIGARATPDEVIAWVRDSGPGIVRSDLERVFERFYRSDRARARDEGGAGLGLAIVKHIVRLHGGRVWAESELGAGSTFYVALPRRPPA